MMAKTFWHERRTDYLWLLLVTSYDLPILPSVTCQYCNTAECECSVGILKTCITNWLSHVYEALTNRVVDMAGYWPRAFLSAGPHR